MDVFSFFSVNCNFFISFGKTRFFLICFSIALKVFYRYFVLCVFVIHVCCHDRLTAETAVTLKTKHSHPDSATPPAPTLRSTREINFESIAESVDDHLQVSISWTSLTQFHHQRFTHAFFIQKLVQSQNVTRKKGFCTKKARKKCWWNWLLKVVAFVATSTERFTDFDKLNLVSWFGVRPEQIITTAQAASKNQSKILENNHLTLLV